MSTTRSLDSLVNVVVHVSPLAAPRASFNQLLIVGPNIIISVSDRIKKYASTDEMITAGFLSTTPEFKAAALYFAAKPAPMHVWIGRKDTAESILQALQACRAKSAEWYACMATEAVKADHIAIALWIESVDPTSIYGYTTADADVLSGAAGNVGVTLKNSAYRRTIGQYSTTPYAIAAILGYAMGANTGLANSVYTLKFKNEIGVLTEALSTTAIGLIEGNNVNLYLSFGNYYDVFEQGVMANGHFFDEIINLDMLKNNIQLNVMDLLYGNPKVPQTDAGINLIVHACNQACNIALVIGFLGAGKWTQNTVLNLNQGDFLPNGYLVQAAALSTQSDADRQARKSPSIYIAVKEAGAIHSVLIGVYVNR